MRLQSIRLPIGIREDHHIQILDEEIRQGVNLKNVYESHSSISSRHRALESGEMNKGELKDCHLYHAQRVEDIWEQRNGDGLEKNSMKSQLGTMQILLHVDRLVQVDILKGVD